MNIIDIIKKMNDEKRHLALIYLFIAIIIAIGIILKLKAYFYNQSLFHDECALAVNILDKNYLELFKPLDIVQVAPPFFMILSKMLFSLVQPFNNIELNDLSLRLIPCICSIASVPLFTLLVQKMFKNYNFTLVCTAFLAFNPVAINYAQEFKQYSIEMLFAIILLLIFQSIDIKTISIKRLSWYSALFCIAPWLATSSIFILFIGLSFVLFDIIKNKYFDIKKILILFLPTILNVLIFYFGYYLAVSKVHSKSMHDFWKNFEPSFFTFSNFIKLFPTKLQYLINIPLGENIFLFLLANTAILVYRKNFKNIYYTLAPILLMILLSFLEIYPFEQRLILFLLPMFIILYSQVIFLFKDKKIITYLIGIVLILLGISQFNHFRTKYILHESFYRETTKIIKENYKKGDNIICVTHVSKYYLSTMGLKENIFKSSDVFSKKEFTKTKTYEILNSLNNNETWVLVPFQSKNKKRVFTKNLKNYLLNNKNIKILYKWESPKNKNIYVIKFQKI